MPSCATPVFRRNRTQNLPSLTAPSKINTMPFRSTEILHDHDVGLVELVLAEEERLAIRRNCHSTKERSGLIEGQDRRGLGMSKIEELNAAVRRRIPVQEIDS